MSHLIAGRTSWWMGALLRWRPATPRIRCRARSAAGRPPLSSLAPVGTHSSHLAWDVCSCRSYIPHVTSCNARLCQQHRFSCSCSCLQLERLWSLLACRLSVYSSVSTGKHSSKWQLAGQHSSKRRKLTPKSPITTTLHLAATAAGANYKADVFDTTSSNAVGAVRSMHECWQCMQQTWQLFVWRTGKVRDTIIEHLDDLTQGVCTAACGSGAGAPRPGKGRRKRLMVVADVNGNGEVPLSGLAQEVCCSRTVCCKRWPSRPADETCHALGSPGRIQDRRTSSKSTCSSVAAYSRARSTLELVALPAGWRVLPAQP